MLTAVIDTNVLVAGLLTESPRSASREIMDRHRNANFTLALSAEALQEIFAVLSHSRIRLMHKLNEAEIVQFCRRLEVGSRMFSGTTVVSPTITRDVTDAKWLALALEANADYLVTLDQRHLRRLKRIGRTRIVTPRAFLNALDRSA